MPGTRAETRSPLTANTTIQFRDIHIVTVVAREPRNCRGNAVFVVARESQDESLLVERRPIPTSVSGLVK